MYNCIHGTAPAYLCNSVVMACDTNERNTHRGDTMQVDVPVCRTHFLKGLIIYLKKFTMPPPLNISSVTLGLS